MLEFVKESIQLAVVTKNESTSGTFINSSNNHQSVIVPCITFVIVQCKQDFIATIYSCFFVANALGISFVYLIQAQGMGILKGR